MATRIFRIDLSEGARDYKSVATEPGLPMLDRAGANNAILRRWLGHLAAEPVWIGDDSINVFVVGDEGRLDKVECQPVTKIDLEGPLAQDLKTLQARIKKAKPESATEQSLHRVVRQTVAQLTTDLEAGGQDSFFFKYKRGKDTKLVWCWGYQRADQEPSPAAICTNPDCHQLFVKRKEYKGRCPNCDETPSARRGGASGASGVFSSRWVQIGGAAAAVLLLLALLLFFGGRTRLVVSPSEISGPAGSPIPYKVVSRRFFFLTSDVTSHVQPGLFDDKIVKFDREKNYARGVRPGKTSVKFVQGNNKVEADIKIGPPATPKTLVIEPKSLKLNVGEEKEVKVTGYYEGSDVKIDLTDYAEWEVEDSKLAFSGGGRVEAFEPGKSKLIARYHGSAGEKHATAEIPLEVAIPAGTLTVTPSRVSLAIGETVTLDIAAADPGAVQVVSSDPKIVEVLPGHKLVGRAGGTTDVIVKSGETLQSVRARVNDTPYKSIHIVPASITLSTGELGKLKVMGTSPDGKVTEISADKLIWIKQPLAQHVNLKPGTLELYGLTPTDQPLEMTVQVGEDLTATAKYEVKKKAGVTISEFVPHPPISGSRVSLNPKYLGQGMRIGTDGVVIEEVDTASPLASLGLPKGTVILGVNNHGFQGATVTAINEYFEKHPIAEGARIQYMDPKDRSVKVVTLGSSARAVVDWRLVDVKAVDSSATDFQAELKLELRESAEYRVLDANDKPLSEWKQHGPNAIVTITTSRIPRVAKDEYDVAIQRRNGANVKKFPFSFRLQLDRK